MIDGKIGGKTGGGAGEFHLAFEATGLSWSPRTEKCQRIYQGGCLRGRHVTRVFTRPKGTRAETLMVLTSILIRFF